MGQRRASTPADKALGLKVRQARNEAEMSQEQLGMQLGVTFQQIQKYEKGVNRVSGTRLVALAKAVQKPVSFFLEEVAYKPGSRGEKIAQFVSSREGHQLCDLMVDMDPELRGKVLGICRSLSSGRVAA